MIKSYLVISLGLLAVVPFLVLDVDAQTLLDLPPRDNFGNEPNSESFHSLYTTASSTSGSFRFSNVRDSISNIADIRTPTTTVSNPVFTGTTTGGTNQCFVKLRTVQSLISGNLIPDLALPSNIQPNQLATSVAFGYYFNHTANNNVCPVDLIKSSDQPLIVEDEMRVTIYNKADKVPYFFSPRENVTAAQPIPVCTSDNYDTSSKTLKGDTKMCYGKYTGQSWQLPRGTHLVIITKQISGFYGAADGIISTIPPPSGFPTEFRSDTLEFTFNVTTNDGQMTNPKTDVRQKTPTGHVFGDIFVQDSTRIVSNPTPTNSTICYFYFDSIYTLNSFGTYTYTPPTNVQPNQINGTRDTIDEIIAVGFHETATCESVLHDPADPPLITDKEMRITLYDQYNKTSYFFSKRANMTEAQPIPVCSAANFDNTTQELKGNTKMCSGTNGTDMVIITKRFTGFYGAATTITDPANPIDLNADGVPTPPPKDPPLPDGVIKIPPPSDFPSGTPSSNTIGLVGFSQSDDLQTAQYKPQDFGLSGEILRRQVTAEPRVGEAFLPSLFTILTNPVFPGINLSLVCPSHPLKNLNDTITSITNIQPTSPIGLGYALENSGYDVCKIVYDRISDYPVMIDKELRFTIYGKYNKSAYYISPRDNVTLAQPIPACSSNNFNITDQTLKGNTKMCYGVNGTNMVIITKRLSGYYGAADSITPPTNPIDLDSSSPSLAVTTSRQDVSDINSLDTFNITSGPNKPSDPRSPADPLLALLDTHGKHTYAAAGTGQSGHIYISPSTIILTQHDSPFLTSDNGKDCVRGHVVSTAHADFDLPANVTGGVAYGFAYTNGTDTCTYNSNSMARQFNVNPPLRIVLYNQAGNQPYSYLPFGDAISQDIPACSSTSFDSNTKIPLGNTKQCYQDVGNDLVIYSEIMQWYGAKTPTTPRDILITPKPSNFKLQPFGTFLVVSTDDAKTGAHFDDAKFFNGTPAGPTIGIHNMIIQDNGTIGNVYVSLSNRLSNIQFTTTIFDKCSAHLRSSSDLVGKDLVPNFVVPDNISPKQSTAIGFDFNATRLHPGCTLDLETASDQPLKTDGDLRFTIYNSAGKQPYYFSPRENIIQAQPIPACTTETLHTNNNTLKGNTEMCYGKDDKDLVILTKRLAFYGAADRIDTPSGDSDDDMANAPSFGVSPLTGEQLVTCGYKMDDTCRDITAYHVQYERDIIQTNTTHTFALKALAPNMIDSFTLAFGVPEVGSPINAAEAYITAKLGVNYTSPSYYNINEITVHDPNNIIDYDISLTEISRVSCSGGALECTQITFPDVLFRDTLYHEPFVVMITDTLLYTSINYMNEGILVTGTPLNKQPTVQPGITVDTGDIRPTKLILVRTDKVNDLWDDAFGNTWSRNSFGNYVIVEYAPYAGTVPVCKDINDRLCAPFKAKLDWHNQRMIELRDSLYTAYTTKAYAEIDNIFTYEFGDLDSRTRTLINLGWLTE